MRSDIPEIKTQGALARTVSAVVFDCFGTLADIGELHFIDAFTDICALNQLAVAGKDLWERWLAASRTIAEEQGRDPANPLAGPEPPFFAYRNRWRRQFERVFTLIEAEADVEAACLLLHGMMSTAQIYPDVPEVITALGRYYRLAVLSNADDDFLTPCLKRSGLAFEAIISSETACSYKPHPGIFCYATAQLDLDPGSTLYVGDSPVADVVGARAAGMLTAWINRPGNPWPLQTPEPDLVIRDLRDLLPVLVHPR